MSSENIIDIYPLSPMQQGMLFHSLYSPQAGMYVVQFTARLEGTLEVTAFEQAWQRVIERHTILATTFHWGEADAVLQVVNAGVKLTINQQDWRDQFAEVQATNLADFLQVDQNTDFDLTAAPLMRLSLVRMDAEVYQMVWSFHHLLLDGWSVPRLLTEVFMLYEALRLGQDLALPPTRPYGDYIEWLQGQEMAAAEVYWRRTLQGFSAPTPLMVDQPLAVDEELPEVYAELDLVLPRFVRTGLQRQARQHGLTLNTLFQGAWSLLLHRYSGEEDILFGATVSGRPAELLGVDNIVGLFINTLPVRVQVNGQTNLLAWLKDLQTRQLEARQYEYSPLMQVQGWSEVPRGISLFESLLVVENLPLNEKDQEENSTLHVHAIQFLQRTNYPLTVVALPGQELTVKVVYDLRRFEAATIERMQGHLATILSAFATGLNRPLAEVPFLTDDEEQLMLDDWNNAAIAAFPTDLCLPRLIEAQAAHRPEALAVCGPDASLTYAEINRQANRLAHYLRKLGVGPETPVAVCLERSARLIAGLLGVLKAGGAYIPLDPTYPAERLAFMLKDSQAAVVLTEAGLRPLLADYNGPVLCLDSDRPLLETESDLNPAHEVLPADLAYVIYTSGSTGQPKGVQIEHRTLLNLIYWHCRAFQVSELDRATQIAGLGFDAVVWEIWPYLATGASLFLPDAETRMSPVRLQSWLLANQITISFFPTPLASVMLDLAWPPDTTLHTLLTGGDKLSRYPDPSTPFVLYNNYGPTESTVVATSGPVALQGAGSIGNAPNIGRTIANTRLYVLDQYRQPVPVGVPGELYIGGDSLARAYLNQPELTAKSFLPDPFRVDVPEARMYKTGDLVRYLPDGSLEFIGRNDFQVKLRGFRIELGEIEAMLVICPGVQEAVVIVREDAPGQKRLVGYIVAKQKAGLSSRAVQDFLKPKLPEYMIPGALVFLDQLPVTPNGKVDRKLLAPPGPVCPEAADTYVGPRNPVEENLAVIWASVLGLERVGIHDNFFELGGDSILSIQVVARATDAGLRLRPKQLFQHPTIAALAVLVATIPALQAEQGAVKGEVPLTPVQSWYFERELLNPHHFNQAFMLAGGKLDPAILQASLGHLLAHHDVLRMRYQPGQPYRQFNRPALDPAELARIFSQHDLTGLTSPDQLAAIEKIAADMQIRLNICEGPLMQVALFELGPQASRLLIVIHHLVVDGVSWRILLEDLQVIYHQLAAGEPVALPAKTTSFKEWSERLVEYALSEEAVQAAQYWNRLRAGEAVLPLDFPGGLNTAASVQTVTVSLSEEETRLLLQETPRAYNTQINDVLLAALSQTIVEWAGTDAALIELEGHGREDIFGDLDISRTVGWFTTLYPVRLEVPAGGPAALLKAVKEQLRQVPDKGFVYGLRRYLAGDSELARFAPPLSFNYLGQFDQLNQSQALLRPSGENVGPESSGSGLRDHLLDVGGHIRQGRLEIHWDYSQKLHARATIEQLAARFVHNLGDIIAHCLLPEAGGFTPSDFPLAHLSQSELDGVVSLAATTTGQAAKARITDIYPLSPMQQGMLFHSVYAPGSGIYCEQLSWRLENRLDPVIFQQTWQQIVDNHPVLRSAFVWQGLTAPVQVVCQDVTLPVRHFDCSSWDNDRQQQWLQNYLAADLVEGFTLHEAPLMRLTLACLGDDAYQFIWSYHHLLLDGWSVALLFQELMQTYAALSRNETPGLVTPSRSYRDYIEWLSAQDMREAETFWRQNLAGFNAPNRLPFGQTGPGNQAANYTEASLTLPSNLAAHLDKMARQHQLTLNTLFQGAWAFLLGRYSASQDVVFGITVSGRPAELAGVENIVGPFINTLPLRLQLDHQTAVADWLAEVQVQQAQVLQFEFTPLVQIGNWSELPGGTSLFDTLLAFENYPVDEETEAQGRQLDVANIQTSERTNYPLSLVIIPGQEIQIRLFYDCTHFDRTVIKRLLDHLQTLLTLMADHPDWPLARLNFLTEAEQTQLLTEWNQTANGYDRTLTVHRAFEEQASLTPQAIALSFAGGALTYAELNERANRLAHYLHGLGVGPDKLVGLYIERSLELVVAILAILKAGGAYVPLDLNYPAERLAYMLKDTAVEVILTQERLLASLLQSPAEVICLDTGWPVIARQSCLNLADLAEAHHLAYVMYTSGSTGLPKGVCITHRNILATICRPNFLNVSDRDVFMLFAPISFDASTLEIWMALLNGARLAVFEPHLPSLDELGRFIEEQGLTVMWATSGLYSQLVETQLAWLGGLRVILSGGDVVSPSHTRRLLGEIAGCTVINGYGPTESTIFATCHTVYQASEVKGSLPIGRAVNNRQLYVLDQYRQPVPVGVPGELYIGGDSLARAYLNQPELTAKSFLPDPFRVDVPEARMYKTGDLVRYLPDGSLEFIGRNDFQVKLRGFRIEIGEIESVISQFPGVRHNVVIVREDVPGQKRLVGYIVTADQAHFELTELTKYLGEQLPDYMLPAVLVAIPALPLMSNGKIDRAALPVPDRTNLETGRAYAAPRNELEVELVALWEEILGVRPVGIYDDFFELGGHSLLSLRLMAQLHTRFGQSLSLAALFETATVAGLAGRLGRNEEKSPLVALQPHGSLPPFFCIHPGSGHIFCYQALAAQLGHDRPFYAVEDPAVYGQMAFRKVEEQAAYYLTAVRQVQPEGPYFLGGWSYGGLVAYEMACQLRKLGQRVALVALLDTGAPALLETTFRPETDRTGLLAVIAAEFTGESGPGLKALHVRLSELDLAGQLAYVAEQVRTFNLALPDIDAAWVEQSLNLFEARLEAIHSYEPAGLYPGRLTLLRAAESDNQVAEWGMLNGQSNPALATDPAYGWQGLTGGPVEIINIPGSHSTILTEPHLTVLAARLGEKLETLQLSAGRAL